MALVATSYVFSSYPKLSTLPDTQLLLEGLLENAEKKNSKKIKVGFVKLVLFFLHSLRSSGMYVTLFSQYVRRGIAVAQHDIPEVQRLGTGST